MAEKSKNASNLSKGLFIGGLIVTLALILYFTMIYPWPDTNVSGTIGGVEKAKKYQQQQISDKDVELQTSVIHALIQNDKIQKLINDPDFQKLAGDNQLKEAFQATLKNAVARSLDALQVDKRQAGGFTPIGGPLQVDKRQSEELQVNLRQAEGFKVLNSREQLAKIETAMSEALTSAMKDISQLKSSISANSLSATATAMESYLKAEIAGAKSLNAVKSND